MPKTLFDKIWDAHVRFAPQIPRYVPSLAGISMPSTSGD